MALKFYLSKEMLKITSYLNHEFADNSVLGQRISSVSVTLAPWTVLEAFKDTFGHPVFHPKKTFLQEMKVTLRQLLLLCKYLPSMGLRICTSLHLLSNWRGFICSLPD